MAASDRRLELGVTFPALVEVTGISRDQLIRMLNGKRNGSVSNWYYLAQALDLPFGDLMAHLDDL